MSLEDSLKQNRDNIKCLIDEIELKEEMLEKEIEKAINHMHSLGYEKDAQLMGLYSDSKDYENSLEIIKNILKH